jgi:hypothetical protein
MSFKNAIYKIKGRFQKIYRQYGWKAVVGIFIYYIVRDVTLYIVLPALVVKGVLK